MHSFFEEVKGMTEYEAGVQDVIAQMERLTNLSVTSLYVVVSILIAGLVFQHIYERYVRELKDEERIVSEIVTKKKRTLLLTILGLLCLTVYVNKEIAKGRNEVEQYVKAMEDVRDGAIQAGKSYENAHHKLRKKHPEIKQALMALRRDADKNFHKYVESLPIEQSKTIQVVSYQKGIYIMKEESRWYRVDLGGKKHIGDVKTYQVQYRQLKKDYYGYGYRGEKYIVGLERKNLRGEK